jgi:hypothetical protein
MAAPNSTMTAVIPRMLDIAIGIRNFAIGRPPKKR